MNANEDFFEAEQPIYRLQYTWEGHESTRPIGINQNQEDQSILCVKFSPSGQSIACAGYRMLKVWDAAGKLESELVCGNNLYIGEVNWSKDENLLVSAGHHVKIWNFNTGKCVKILREHEYYVFSAKFSPDDSLILSGDDDGTARIWDAKYGVCLNILIRQARVEAVDFHHDGTRFMVTSRDGYCYVYDLRSMDIVEDLSSEDRAIATAKFSPDSRYILFSMEDYSLRLYDMRKQKVAGIYKRPNTVVASVSCSNYSLTTSRKYIISGSFANEIHIWDINTQELVEVLGHSSYVDCIDCHPVNDTIVSGSSDNLIQIWKSS